MSDATPAPHASSVRFAAVTATLARFVERCVGRWRTHQGTAHYRHDPLPDEELETMARYARMEAYAAVREAYDIGRAEGRASARDEIGLPAEGEPWPETPTTPGLACPLCGKRRTRAFGE